MVKVKKSKNQPTQLPAVGVGAPFMPSFPFGTPQIMGQLQQRQVTNVKEGVSEYTLDDGTVLKVKPVIVDVKRAIDQYGVDGKPLYILTLTNITETTSPSRLMRPRANIGLKRKARK